MSVNKFKFFIPITLSVPKTKALSKLAYFSFSVVDTSIKTLTCKLGLSLDITVILQLPALIPTTIPFLSTVAILLSLELYVTVLLVA